MSNVLHIKQNKISNDVNNVKKAFFKKNIYIKSCKSPSKVKVQKCCTWVRLCCLFNLHVSLVLDWPHCLDFWQIFVKHCGKGFWEHFEKWNFYENSNQLRWYFYTSLFYYSADPCDWVFLVRLCWFWPFWVMYCSSNTLWKENISSK